MKIKALCIAALAICSTTAFAGGFDGTYAQISVGDVRNSAKFSGTDTDLDGKTSRTQGTAQLSLGVSKAYDNNFNLAIGAFYQPGELKAGSRSLTAGTASLDLSYKGKNTWGITVEPGYNFNNVTLVYFKTGYVKTTGVLSANISVPGASASLSEDSDFNGFIVGLGGKYKFSKNLYASAELQRFVFNKKDDVSPNTIGAYLGLGVIF